MILLMRLSIKEAALSSFVESMECRRFLTDVVCCVRFVVGPVTFCDPLSDSNWII